MMTRGGLRSIATDGEPVAQAALPIGSVTQNAVHVSGWWVPAGDPWFIPHLRATGGRMDRETMATALKYVADSKRMDDVGAHIGTWARPLSDHFEKVVAPEPDAEVFQLLLAKPRDASACGKVRPVRLALWDEAARLELHRIGVNSGENRVAPVNGKLGGQPVQAVRLDDLALDRVGLIKINVEGAGLHVLNGAIRTITTCRPVVVVEKGHAGCGTSVMLAALSMIEVARHPIAPCFPVENVVMAWPPDTSRLRRISC
jgi:FkbM family methyltransferase